MIWNQRRRHVVAAVSCALLVTAAAPPGRFVRKADPALLARTAFRKEQPVVGTYYFYLDLQHAPLS